MHVGDVVCFKQEFLSGYSGVNAWASEIADCCGEIIELRPHGVARVRWDDNTESSAKMGTQEVVKSLPTYPDDHYQQNLLAWRALMLAEIAILGLKKSHD